MIRRNNNLERLKKSETFPNDFLDDYEKDYDELVIEEKEKADMLNDDIKSKLFTLFDNGYNSMHIQNIIHTQLVKSIGVENVI